jgi:hypothetical protein
MRIRIQDPGSCQLGIRDPRWKKSDPGSRINISDPQHCILYIVQISFKTRSKQWVLGTLFFTLSLIGLFN